MVTKQQHTAFTALTALAPSGQHGEHHERAAMALMEAAPEAKRGSLQSIIDQAREQAERLGRAIDWSKVAAAFIVAYGGGFSAEAIKAAGLLLLGGGPTPTPTTTPTPPAPAPAVHAQEHAQAEAPQAESSHGFDA